MHHRLILTLLSLLTVLATAVPVATGDIVLDDQATRAVALWAGPLLSIGLVLALSLACRPFMTHLDFVAPVLVLIFLPPLMAPFAPFQLSSVSFVTVLLMAMGGGVMAGLARSQPPAITMLAGFFGGLALWFDRDALFIVVWPALLLCLLWLGQGGRYLLQLVRFLQGCFVPMIFVVIDHDHWARLMADAGLSGQAAGVAYPHLVLFACAVAYWSLFEWVGRNRKSPGRAHRLLVGFLGLLGFVLVTTLIFPSLLPPLSIGPGLATLDHYWPYLIPTPIGLAFCGHQLIKVDDDEKSLWFFWGGLLLLLMGFTIWQDKWVAPLLAATVLPWSLVLIALWKNWNGKAVPVRVGLFFFFLLGPSLLTGTLQ